MYKSCCYLEFALSLPLCARSQTSCVDMCRHDRVVFNGFVTFKCVYDISEILVHQRVVSGTSKLRLAVQSRRPGTPLDVTQFGGLSRVGQSLPKPCPKERPHVDHRTEADHRGRWHGFAVFHRRRLSRPGCWWPPVCCHRHRLYSDDCDLCWWTHQWCQL